MPSCPACSAALRTIRQREGIYFYCDECRGRAVTVPQVRRVAGDRFAMQLLRKINRAAQPTDRPCPFCGGKMRQFQNDQPLLTLDTCRPCNLVWFDASEFEALPERAIESTDALILRGREALAVEQARQIANRSQTLEDELPEEKWKWLAAFLGMPVELETPGLKRLPWVTWSLSILILVASLLGFLNLKSAVEQLGFVPGDAWRDGGFTFVSSFFLHAGVWHLVGNLYFLLIFGDNVEDYLGRLKFILLIAFSDLGGSFLAMMLQPGSAIPTIGASGGISGVLAFYAFEFPRARLAFFFRFFYWARLPAWGAFVIWILLQVFAAVEQLSGIGEVSGLAHLGGAGVGLGLWLAWGNSMKLRHFAPTKLSSSRSATAVINGPKPPTNFPSMPATKS